MQATAAAKPLYRITDKKYCPLWGLLSFLIYSLSFIIGYGEEAADHRLVLVKAGLIAVSALLFVFACRTGLGEETKVRYAVLGAVILIYQLLLFAAVGRTILYIRDYVAILNSIVWIACSLMAVIRFRSSLVSWLKTIFTDRDTRVLIIWSSILSVFVILLSIEPNGIRFTWDSNELYKFTYGLGFESLYDGKLMMFHNHVSMIYSYLIVLMKLLFGNMRLAYFLLNAICITAASFGTMFLLRLLIPGKKNVTYVLGAAMFVLSPWVCGLSTYHKYDYYIWCLFALLIYYMVRGNTIGFVLVGGMITFSKSSGLIVFGSVCIGIVITDLINLLREQSFGKSLLRMAKTARYWYYLAIAAVFFFYFKFGIPKETQLEDAVIGIDVPHILHQFKLYNTANFIWVFVILTLLCIRGVFISKKIVLSPLARNTLIVLLISDVIFVVFNFLYITYRLPRYLNSHITVVYIISALFLISLDKKKVSYALMGAITLVTFIGSFTSIDPVSLALFSHIDVGDRTVIDFEMTSRPSLGDSIVYNREYYSYEIALNKALTYVIDDRSEEDGMIFSMGEHSHTWGFSGGRYSYNFADQKRYFEEFYDTRISGLANGYAYEYFEMPEMIPFNMRYVFPQENVTDVVAESDAQTFYYIYMPTMNSSKEADVYANYDVIEEKQFEFRGWKINCVKFTR